MTICQLATEAEDECIEALLLAIDIILDSAGWVMMRALVVEMHDVSGYRQSDVSRAIELCDVERIRERKGDIGVRICRVSEYRALARAVPPTGRLGTAPILEAGEDQ